MRNLIYLGLVISLFTSCEKDDSPTIDKPVERPDYLPMEVGNYWVYEYYEIDTLGNETKTDRVDSVVITKDTIINNHQYYIFEGTDFGGPWQVMGVLRDSSGYIVNEKGQVRFSANNFTDTLVTDVNTRGSDTVYVLTYQMKTVDDPVNVPAGSFEVLNFKGTLTVGGQDPDVENPRFLDNLYSENVGRLLESYYFLSGSVRYEKRLLRYNVEGE